MDWLAENWRLVAAGLASLGVILCVLGVFVLNYKVGGFARGAERDEDE